MLDRVPKADGIVLTFIETGARAERQASKKLKTKVGLTFRYAPAMQYMYDLIRDGFVHAHLS